MGLQNSGTISIDDIAAEFGGTAPHAISEYYGAGGAPSSGQLRVAADFYGRANMFAFSVTSGGNNANLATLATAAGWDGTSALQCTINSGVYISSTSTSTPALTISGSFPSGVTLINNGYIVGRGGNGGRGATAYGYPGSYGGGGASGGGALSVSSPVTIINNGTIAGGGGGGGGGASQVDDESDDKAGGGGGGGGRSNNAANASGGGGGYGQQSSGGSGGTGYANTQGGGGSRGYQDGTIYGGSGGSGGGWGSGGSRGGSAGNRVRHGGGGGGAGYAVAGNSNVTWTATGTRLGSVS